VNFPISIEKNINFQINLLQEFKDNSKNNDYDTKKLSKLLKIFLDYIVNMLDLISKSKFVKDLEKHVNILYSIIIIINFR